MKETNVEIEVRFLEIDVPQIITRLKKLNATDLGEDFFREIIFYDKELTWRPQRKLIRMRQTKDSIVISYKHKPVIHSISVQEVEMHVNDWEGAKLFLEKIGFVAYREQQKKRHSFRLQSTNIDIDKWPSIPTYLELEGESEEKLKETAKLLGLDWKDAVFGGAGYVIEHFYNIPVSQLRHFTFEKIE